MTQPMRLTVGERNSASGTIAQRLVFCGQERGKLLALRQLISEGIKPPIIVFVQSKVWGLSSGRGKGIEWEGREAL